MYIARHLCLESTDPNYLLTPSPFERTTVNRWKAKADARAHYARENAGIEVEKQKSQLEVTREKQQHKRQLRDQRHRDRIQRANRRRADRNRRDNDKTRREKLRRERIEAAKTRVRDNVAGVASAGVYIIALSAAAIGQMQTAAALGLPWVTGAVFVAFLEGGAISAALTAHKARLDGERSLMAQSIMIGLTAAAVAIQTLGHSDRLEGAIMATATVTAVVVFEMRMSIAVMESERKRGIKPPARFGLRRWIVAPISTVRAWRHDVVSTASGQAKVALSALADRRAEKRTTRGHRKNRSDTADSTRTPHRTVRAYYRTVRTAMRTGNEPPPPPSALASTALSNLLDTDEPLPVECPDSVPQEWTQDPRYAARTPSADTPDNSPDNDEDADADSPDRTAELADTGADGTRTGGQRTGHIPDSEPDNARTRGQSPDTDDHNPIPVHVATAYQDHLSANGKPPSARQLASITGIGKTSAHKYIKYLKETQK